MTRERVHTVAGLAFALALIAAGPAQGQSSYGNRSKAEDSTRQSCDGRQFKPRQWAAIPEETVPPIRYHGGPIMLGEIHIYYIWYGNWSGNTATTILTDFAGSIDGSLYFDINTTYTDASGGRVSDAVTFIGSTDDHYSQGTTLTDAAVEAVVTDAISSHRLPSDPHGVYFVLTSADVTESSGLCSQYCGWHTHVTAAGNDIKYAFVGNPERCIDSCAAQPVGPNGNAGADGMASIIAHELAEAATDPDLDAWFDERGAENADKCAWTFGSTYSTPNGAVANIHLGQRDYLIQQNWSAGKHQHCALALPI
ncbi:MAG TPA: hypothetical protein VI504_03270 [Candidatus Eisenbacteria bacterium]